jgi:hypothetical protein
MTFNYHPKDLDRMLLEAANAAEECQVTDYDVTEAMLKHGGSFVRQLATLIRLADEDNRRRLVAAFPEYMAKYRDLASKVPPAGTR